MIFWSSVFLSLSCILSAGDAVLVGRQGSASGGKTCQLNKWDILFFLSSWQMFNLGIWQNYLATTQVADPYRIASFLCGLLTIFYIVRSDIKISAAISREAVKEWLMWTIILLGILLPIGFSIGFLRWNPKLEMNLLKTIILDYFIFVAITEELVWRGLFYNLAKRIMSDKSALLLTTAFFAVIYTHIASGGHFPNWPYVGMAFLAGGAYGISYYRTGNILVPILIHGTVDSIWRIFFS